MLPAFLDPAAAAAAPQQHLRAQPFNFYARNYYQQNYEAKQKSTFNKGNMRLLQQQQQHITKLMRIETPNMQTIAKETD